MSENIPSNNLKPEKPTLSSTAPAFFRKKWVQNSLWVLAFTLIFFGLRPYMQGNVVEGQVPIIKGETITGKPFDLQNIQEPFLIHFWATWCPICDTTQSGIEALAKDYRVINIATQSGDDAYLLAHAKENNMNPDLILNDKDGKIMQAFGARAVPASFIIDAEGQIRFIEVGFTTGVGLRLRFWWLSIWG